MWSRKKGYDAEEIAVKFLKKKGYKILKRNYFTKVGEIDIIARKKKLLVFVEVKSVTGEDVELAEEKVDFKKQHKIIKVAKHFILTHQDVFEEIEEIRFDVIVVKGKNLEEVLHYESAFCEGDFTWG
ncbi:MAG: YraN family protein [Thermodesulfobacteria bacterium]|nr:YraN family protein [Thermodesulfobacteriota bacterium]